MESSKTGSTLTTLVSPIDICLLEGNLSNRVFYTNLSQKCQFSYVSPVSVKYVLKGSEIYLVDGRKHVVNPNQFLVVRSGSHITTILDSHDETEGISVFIGDHLFQSVVNQGGDYPDIKLLEAVFHSCNNYLGRMLIELHQGICDGNQPGTEALKRITEGVITNQREVDEKIESIQSSKPSTKMEVFKNLLRAEIFIEDNLTRKINLDHLCEVAGLSRFHFLRKFHEAYGLSPHQFIIRRKIQRSCQLIHSENKSLSEIAHLTGFGDIHIFSKVFRRVMGFPPSVLKKAS